MLTQPTLEKLCTLRLRGMAAAFREQQEDPAVHRLSFEERLGLLIDRQWNWRANRALERRLRNARLEGPACVEDIDFRTPRGLDRPLVRSLTAESVWVREHQNLFLLGPTGIGKTWLARAFGQKACRDGYTAYFTKATELFRDLGMARADGSLRKLLYRLSRVDVLIVDDWAMAPLAEGERREFLEICDERYQARSTLLTSQLPVSAWHAQIGDPTVADSILDRLVHNAHRLELAGESLRKKRTAKPTANQ
ncbi:MAG: transposase [Acidobacteria bacterium]|nr:transposase [Acidobacteriota bacterium]